jgi:hypothetical protein
LWTVTLAGQFQPSLTIFNEAYAAADCSGTAYGLASGLPSGVMAQATVGIPGAGVAYSVSSVTHLDFQSYQTVTSSSMGTCNGDGGANGGSSQAFPLDNPITVPSVPGPLTIGFAAS